MSYILRRLVKQTFFKHTLEVVDELRKLNERFDFDYETCEVACLLHDVGRVVSKDQIVDLCQEYGYKVSPSEKNVPSLLHQIASRIISQQVFGISNESVLSAVECHTTLKESASETDEIVFLSDKLSWRDPSHLDMVGALNEKLPRSIRESVYYYLSTLFEAREDLTCYHRWSESAYYYYTNER